VHDSNTPSLLTRLSGFSFFCLLTIACFTWFIWSAFNLISQIQDGSSVISFDKGSMYMLGAGIGLAILTLGGLYQGVMRLKFSTKQERVIRDGVIAGIIIMFVFPHVVHYPVSEIMKERNYYRCEKMSYRWLLYKKLIYTDTLRTCESLVREEQITRSSSGR